MSCEAYFLQGAIKACGFPQLQAHSFGMTFRYRSCCGSPQAADVRLACETMLVGNAGISVCFHFCK